MTTVTSTTGRRGMTGRWVSPSCSRPSTVPWSPPSLAVRGDLIEAAGLRVVDTIQTLHRRWVTLTLAERPAV